GEYAERARELSGKVSANSLASPVNPLVSLAFAGEPPQSLADVAARYARIFHDATQPDPAPAETSRPASAIFDPARESIRRIVIGEDAPGSLPQERVRQLFSPMIKMQTQQLGADVERLEAQHPGAPLRAMAILDNAQPANSRVFLRGNPN